MAEAAVSDAKYRAARALTASPVTALRELRVERSGRTLRLHGRVHCFYHKQLAQELVRPAAKGLRLVNQVVVE